MTCIHTLAMPGPSRSLHLLQFYALSVGKSGLCPLAGETCKLTHVCIYTINHYCWFKIKFLTNFSHYWWAIRPGFLLCHVLGVSQDYGSQERPATSHCRQKCQFATRPKGWLKLRKNTRNPKEILNTSTSSYSHLQTLTEFRLVTNDNKIKGSIGMEPEKSSFAVMCFRTKNKPCPKKLISAPYHPWKHLVISVHN